MNAVQALHYLQSHGWSGLRVVCGPERVYMNSRSGQVLVDNRGEEKLLRPVEFLETYRSDRFEDIDTSERA